MKNLAIFSLVAIAAAANASVLDSFTTGPASVSIKSGTFVATQNSAAIATGQRDIELKVNNNPFHQDLDVKILDSGFAVVSNGFGVESTVKLQYDGLDEVGNTGAGKVLTNSSAAAGVLGNGNAFLFRFVENDREVRVDAILRKNGAILSSGTATQPALSGASNLSVAVNAADVAAADSVTFVFNADSSGDFGIRSIEVVPEPTAIAAVVAGLGLLVARRKRS